MSEEVASRAGAEGEESASLWGFADEEHASEPHGNIPENALDEGVREGRFITYWSDKETGRPVRWVFFDGAEFEVRVYERGYMKAGEWRMKQATKYLVYTYETFRKTRELLRDVRLLVHVAQQNELNGFAC